METDLPRVSIIIPTYNRPNLLERAIESALSQTLDNIEVIVVDDGSNTDNEAVMSRFDDPRLFYIEHDENQGGSAARNTGIERAKGNYIAFLDDDDEWRSSKLSRQVKVLDDLPSEWIAAYCDVDWNRKNTIVGWIDSLLPSDPGLVEGGEELIAEIMMKRLHIGGSSVLVIKSSAVKSVDGFDESFDRHQDIEFLVRLLKIGKLKYIDAPLVIRHSTENPSLEAVLRGHIEYLSNFSDDIFHLKEQGDDVLGAHEFVFAKHYFLHGKFRKGIGSLIKSHIPRKKDYIVIIYTIIVGISKKVNNI